MNTVVTCICPNLHYYFLKYGKISKTFSFSGIVILLKFDAQIDANGVFESLNFKILPRTPLNSIYLAPPALSQYCMTKHKALVLPLMVCLLISSYNPFVTLHFGP